jgi:hypothetical protein
MNVGWMIGALKVFLSPELSRQHKASEARARDPRAAPRRPEGIKIVILAAVIHAFSWAAVQKKHRRRLVMQYVLGQDKPRYLSQC